VILSNTFSEFLDNKNDFYKFCIFYILANVLLGVDEHATRLLGHVNEGEIWVLTGLAPFSQTIRSLLRTQWLTKQANKIQQKVIWKIHFNEKTLISELNIMMLTFLWLDKVGFYKSYDRRHL
jgi:hypothetical protein